MQGQVYGFGILGKGLGVLDLGFGGFGFRVKRFWI